MHLFELSEAEIPYYFNFWEKLTSQAHSECRKVSNVKLGHGNYCNVKRNPRNSVQLEILRNYRHWQRKSWILLKLKIIRSYAAIWDVGPNHKQYRCRRTEVHMWYSRLGGRSNWDPIPEVTSDDCRPHDPNQFLIFVSRYRVHQPRLQIRDQTPNFESSFATNNL